MSNQQRRGRLSPLRSRTRLPRRCPISFEFDINRVECKVCPYFDACLRVYTLAKRIARE